MSAEQNPTVAPFLCWAGMTTFRKNGTPVLGTMGASADVVVVMRREEFIRLCKELPNHQFKIGNLDG